MIILYEQKVKHNEQIIIHNEQNITHREYLIVQDNMKKETSRTNDSTLRNNLIYKANK